MAGSVIIDIGEGTFFIKLYDINGKLVDMFEVDDNKLSISLAAWDELNHNKKMHKPELDEGFVPAEKDTPFVVAELWKEVNLLKVEVALLQQYVLKMERERYPYMEEP
jgi:hypothetical protein